MKHFVLVVLAMLMVCVGATARAASKSQLIDEINAYIITPCHMYTIEKSMGHNLSQKEKNDMLQIMRLMTKNDVEAGIAAALELIYAMDGQNKSFEERAPVYEFLLANCKIGADSG